MFQKNYVQILLIFFINLICVPKHCIKRMGIMALTHWGRVTHICVSKPTTIGLDNGLSPGRHQAIIWTNAGIFLIGPLGTNLSEILSKIHTFSLKKMHWKMAAILSQPQSVNIEFGVELTTWCNPCWSIHCVKSYLKFPYLLFCVINLTVVMIYVFFIVLLQTVECDKCLHLL